MIKMLFKPCRVANLNQLQSKVLGPTEPELVPQLAYNLARHAKKQIDFRHIDGLLMITLINYKVAI